MISIDYQDKRPIYEQLAEKFQMLIIRGILETDQQMPSVRQIATDLSINPNTVQKAYALLEQRGFIYPVKGRGNFVSERKQFLETQQNQFLQECRKMLIQGRDLHIKQEKIQNLVSQIYKEERYD